MSFNKYDKTNQTLNRVAGGTLFADAPIGSIIPFGGATVPKGFLICDGTAVSRTTYADLFKVIGTAFGEGDSSTTFNVPDLREATTKGAGLTSKSSNHMDADGLALGEFLDDRVQEHNHYVHNGTASVWESNVDGGSSPTASDLRSAGPTSDNPRLIAKDISYGRHGATTEVKAVGVNYIIKATHSVLPADFMDALDTKQNVLTFDNVPTQNSNNPVKSKGIYSAINDAVENRAPLFTGTSAEWEALTSEQKAKYEGGTITITA